MDKVLVIVGPTAVGKSDLAIQLAKQFNGEIINGDSVQVYKELNIGSAKVSDTQGIVHRLIDYKEVEDDYNVAEFQKAARAEIAEVLAKGKLPIIVGGTGLYIKALLYDYCFAQESADRTEDFEQYDNETLYQKLMQIDPKSCEIIHPNNRKRVIRALQIAQNGTTKSEQENEQSHQMLYQAKIVGLTMDREKLKLRIDQRVDQMMENGLVEETQSLFSRYRHDAHAFTAIGYKEMLPYYKQQSSLEEACEAIKTHTRQFAKRQYTWFKHQMPVDWYDIEESGYLEKIIADTKRFLNE